MQKPRCCAKSKSGPGVEKTPTETPTGGTKIGAEGLKPQLKDGSVFGKNPGRRFENRVGVIKTPTEGRVSVLKNPGRCLDNRVGVIKNRVGVF